jgi:hypothetical protein
MSNDPIETPEYKAGKKWTAENLDQLRELFTGRQVDTDELRKRLFEEAERRYPRERGDMVNDRKQTLWVAGAFRPLVDLLSSDAAGMLAVMEVSSDIGGILGAETGKMEALEELKKKPESWWRRSFGDATPYDLLEAFAIGWRRRPGRGLGEPVSRWEILIDMLGTREMWAFATLKSITEQEHAGGRRVWDVRGTKNDFDVIAEDFRERGILHQGAGDIVG